MALNWEGLKFARVTTLGSAFQEKKVESAYAVRKDRCHIYYVIHFAFVLPFLVCMY